jgi:transitional endoplasmic reticulum ATPase
VVRLSAQTMSLLGLRPWDPLRLVGRRLTGALVATAPPGTDNRVVLCDELTLRNLGLPDGGDVEARRALEQPARTLVLSGPPELSRAVPPDVLRLALLGKVVTQGDEVSLLPQDFVLPDGTDPGARDAARGRLAAVTGAGDWQSVLLLVAGADPREPAIVTMGTVVGWSDGASTSGGTGPALLAAASAPTAGRQPPAPAPGLEDAAADLREWLDLGFHGHDLLRRLGTQPHLGILISGPDGSGKATLVESAAAAVGATVRRVGGPRLASLDPAEAARELAEAADRAAAEAPCVLLVRDVEVLAPRDPAVPAPLAEPLLDTVRRLVPTERVAVVCTSAHPEAVSPRLREPGMLDRELVVPLPAREQRRRMLESLTHAMPLVDVDLDDVAARAPGFVLADLVGLCREAAVRAAHRHRADPPTPDVAPTVTASDFDAALDVVRPTAMQGDRLELPDLTLDDVGDMAEVKQALTEAVIWPLTYPETFDRLGVQAPRGVLLYGPPGCGKTFLVRALAGSGRANVLSVKGAELLTKWVGESERGVRELFRRARHAAPAIVFLDEVDALLPTRGGSSDGGVTDRVVAAVLTELDGIEGLRDVCVVAATNRPDIVDPAMLRPGRLDRVVYVGPPDAAARAEILAAASRRTPLAPDVDLAALAVRCDGFSAADCAALVREAALVAMRESMESAVVTAGHVESARAAVQPSLDPAQLAELERFAAARG